MTLKELFNRREFDWFKTCNEHNLNKTTHALDKLYIRMMAFYGIPMKHLQEKTGFICLKLGKYRILSLISVIQTLFCF
jgi:hypothetical protein